VNGLEVSFPLSEYNHKPKAVISSVTGVRTPWLSKIVQVEDYYRRMTIWRGRKDLLESSCKAGKSWQRWIVFSASEICTNTLSLTKGIGAAHSSFIDTVGYEFVGVI